MNDRGYKEKTSISIDPEILAKAREIAAKERRSLSNVIEILLDRYVNEADQ